jgi:NAD(P)-dependent dehydrogenase (short-subunit alcohol dehydrogenase family)
VELRDKIAVVTGAGHGIGAALAKRLAAELAGAVVVSDIDESAANTVAEQIEDAGGQALAVRVDVSQSADVKHLVATAERRFGPVDVYCSNAGVTGGGLWVDDDAWARTWGVNVMGHVHAARALVPGMLRRGGGYLMTTVSAAGLLTMPGDAPYATTKHAALGFAEWLACTYSPRGLRVSALCPLGVWTDMFRLGIEQQQPSTLAIAASGPVLSVEEVADCAIRGMIEERFLILPHEVVRELQLHKAADRDDWIARTAALAGYAPSRPNIAGG